MVGPADTGHGEADKTDEATARFGIRDLSVTVDGLSIDGEDHMLRGAYIHHDNGMLGAATFRDAETRRCASSRRRASTPSAARTTRPRGRCSTPVEAGLRWNKTLADKVRAKATKTRESGKQASNRGVILLMNMVKGAMSRLMTWIVPKPIIDRETRDAYAQLDVPGYNHTGVRMVADHELHPGRVMVCSEETPKLFMQTWCDTQDAPWALGNFVRTGWDYLGEGAVAAARYNDHPRMFAPFPALTAGTPVIDITGHRQPQSYAYEIG